MRVWVSLLAMLVAAGAAAQTIYKYVDENGRTIYTDSPPKSAKNAKPVTMEKQDGIRGVTTVPPAAPKPAPTPQSASGGRDPNVNDAERGVEKAEAALAQAKQALKEAVPADDEWTTVVNRTDPKNPVVRRFPGEKFQSRLNAMEQAVKDAEANLTKAEETAGAARRGK